MKKLLVMAAMVLSSVGAFAQYSAGDFTIQPKVGLNCSSFTDGDGLKYKAGFVGGVEAEYHVSPLIGISGGLLYSMQGTKVDSEEGDVKYNFDYLNIPILANVYVAKGLALKAGIQPAFKLSAKAKANGVSIDFDKLADAAEDLIGGKTKAKSFDFAIPVGISYEYMNFCLDARYNIGLTKVADLSDSHNSVFQLTLGYKFKL